MVQSEAKYFYSTTVVQRFAWQLLVFKLVNMQGRLYDPLLCRFLSPDPYVQAPENSQSLNRYSYCLNNPMVYSDPSGLMSNLEWAIRGALRNGRNDVYWNGFYMNFGFTGWGDSPNFGDIYRGLFNGSTAINITANYVSYGAGSSSGSDARSAFGSAAPKLIDGPVCRLTGFSVNVVKVEGAPTGQGGNLATVSFIAGAASLGYDSWQNLVYDGDRYTPTKGPTAGQKTSVWKMNKSGNYATRNGARMPNSANAASKIRVTNAVKAGGVVLMLLD